MTYLIHAIAACALLAGCANSPSPTPTTPSTTTPASPTKEQPMNSSVTLQPERTVAVSPNANLRYDGVSDSRCPPGMKCVWAGELAYQFTLSGPAGNEMFGLTAAKPAFDLTSIPGVRIALGQGDTPPPVAAAGTPPAAMPVTVNITRK